MKKNKNLKSHPEFSSGSHEILNQVQHNNQAGRSMVEMLGVLAIIGVLSVAGIAGYTTFMNKHRANELLNGASKRAAVVAVQAMQGHNPLSIEEFPDNTELKFNSNVTHDTTSNQFTLEISGIAEAVCQQMKNIKGPIIRKFDPTTCSGDNNTVKLTYNDDMSVIEKPSDFTYDTCPKNFYKCLNLNKCVNSKSDCPTCAETYEGTVANGAGGFAGNVGTDRCYCENVGYVFEATNGCQEKSGTSCSSFKDCDNGEYCLLSSVCGTSGTCKAISSVSSISGTISINNNNYPIVCSGTSPLKSVFMGEDWCLAQGGRLINYTEVCNIQSLQRYDDVGVISCNDNNQDLRDTIHSICHAGNGSDHFWASHPDNNKTTCYVFSYFSSLGTYETAPRSDRRTVCILP